MASCLGKCLLLVGRRCGAILHASLKHSPLSFSNTFILSSGLDEKIAGLTMARAREILRGVNGRLMGRGWYGLSIIGALRRMTLLQKMLNTILMGHGARRHELIDPEFPGVTWGMLEAEGLVKLNLLVSNTNALNAIADPPLIGSSHLGALLCPKTITPLNLGDQHIKL